VAEVVLDFQGLTISKIEWQDGDTFGEVPYEFKDDDKVLGAAVRIQLPKRKSSPRRIMII
jgi:hypothetical protein